MFHPGVDSAMQIKDIQWRQNVRLLCNSCAHAVRYTDYRALFLLLTFGEWGLCILGILMRRRLTSILVDINEAVIYET